LPDVVDRARQLAEAGVREVVLTGVDLTAWGEDLGPDLRLGHLVEGILREVPELPRLRLSSIDPVEIDNHLLDIIGSCSRLMPHLHLSVQAGDDLILKRMKRRHLRDDVIRLSQKVRSLRPDVTFGADFIAGFPTETEAHFDKTIRLVRECDLTWLHVFPFSARAGTPAARMPQVPSVIIRKRAARLRKLGSGQVAAYLKSRIGHKHRVLMETSRLGRSEHYARVEFSEDQKPGDIVTVRITGARSGSLLA